VLVEESTGAWCQYCPDGAVKLQQLIDANPKVIGVSIHGGGTDNMRFAEGDNVTSLYFTAFPLGMVDRTPGGTPVAITINRGYWASAATSQAALAPDFDVTLNHGYNPTTRVITAQVKTKAIKAVTGAFNVNLYIVEDSVKGTGSGWNQVNYYNTQAGHPYYGAGNPIVGFNHMHVVREILGGVEGTTGVITTNPALNSTGTKTYTYTLPAGYNYKNIKLVAMVQKSNPADKTLRPINNAIQSKLTPGTLGVTNVATLTDIEVFPNPAADNIRVTGVMGNATDLHLTLSNAVGQTVISRDVQNNGSTKLDEVFSVSSLSNGIYFLNVRNDEAQNTVRVVVNH
jgi:hypothetical protein